MGAQETGERQVNRVELVAALLEYDDEPAEGFGTSLNSAILKPYRHILVPPSPARNEPEYDDLDDDFKSVAPNGKRELAEEDYRDVQARYARSVLERGGNDLTEEERLTAEWGLKQHFSQLGSGSDLGDYAIADSPEYDTRSLPDLLDRRTSTFSTASTSALETAASLAPSTSQLRIAEYAQGARPRSRSLGHDLAIPHFDPLPSLVIPDDDLLTARPRPRRSSTLDDGFAHPRPRSRAMSGTSKRLSIASIATMLSRQELDNHHEPGDRRQSFHDRRLAFLSGGGADTTSALLDDEPLAESVSAVEWTSRFDPQMLVLARQADKERAVFVNKDAGATPKSLLMPTPLAGQARAPFKRTRTEGPETIIPQTQEEADEMAALEKERNTRPAGALFGRSLMDVMAEKQAALKAKQRHYVPGNDGRRSMMDPDWGKPKPLDIADDLFLSDAASEKGLAPPRLPRGKSTLSIFGPDLFYARDLERLREMERVEAEEDELEALKEADMWEKERLKAEKKQTSKMRKAAERKLEGLDVKDASESPELERPAHRRTHSIAPSLALPTALTEQEVDTTNWFSPPSPTSSTSSLPRRRGDSRRQTFAALSPTDAATRHEPQLVTQSPKQHEAELRAAVMVGSLSASEAVGQMGSYNQRRSLEGNDQRLYGEQFFSRGYEAKGLQAGVDLDSLDRRFGTMSVEERHDLDGLGYSSPPIDVEEDDDDDDDVPLGVRHPEARAQMDEDDMPLAFNHLSGATHDEDDQPLGFIHPAAAYAQHQHQHEQAQIFQSHQQQQHMYSHAMMMQQQQAMMQQSFEQQMMAMQGGGMEFGGGNDSVARWRQGIRSTSQQS